MADEHIPKYIRQTLNYQPNDILEAQDYNDILNLIITQGDYNTDWLVDIAQRLASLEAQLNTDNT